ncbi:HAMP domain-containing histidine kinase [Nonomuraea sp. KC401]|uniref:sensor histidine kinase n=1 Tax=unclassified Nonomuraea TaxID=2593643 RepID=UPI0010FE96B6|nr:MULTISPECIES: HAMP domain-containing sensor histidine kinase [unclassified Nonomuraea]NBE99542.1 HAMP domain-containing protein [Nonomuraea sp. K271]TLF54822.1 HAMP domain-containing histidine kinase [Nonomuraea sp. KC401]
MRGLPLRIKLIASMLALLGFGMTFIGLVSVSVLHGYLIDRVDSQLHLLSLRMHKKVLSDWRRDRETSDRPIAIESDAIVLVKEPGAMFEPMLTDRDVDMKPKPILQAAPGAEPYNAPAIRGDGEWRVLESMVRKRTLVVAVDLEEVDAITRRLVLIELLGGGGILLILAVVGITIVRRSMRPLAQIERTAEAIAAGELGRRVPDGDPRTEVGRLARSLNGMLAQIEAAFAARSDSEAAARRSEVRMREFVGDASHELRTPLTSIRGFAEYARQNPGADPTELMQRVEKAAGRMSLLVDDLLLLARVDQQRPLKMRPVDMLALAADAVHDARILAPDRTVKLDVVGGAALIVSGDEVRLRQIISNLVTNAIIHTEPGTPITVRAGAGAGTLFLEVVDSGPGLTPDQLDRVFERFYRADSARSRRRSGEDRGSGLGLAIVQALVAAHGGTVTVESSPEDGSTFRVELPLALE